MKNRNLTPFSLLTVLPIIFLSFFLNYLSSSYSEVDLFKLDLVKRRKLKTTRKLIFILKNSQLFFVVVCFFQVILNALISIVLVDNLSLVDVREKKWLGRTPLLLGIAFIIALFTELLARFLAVRKSNRKIVLSNFFVNLTYLILRPFSFLQVLIKPKKKLFSSSEQDLIRFFDNLMVEKVLEDEEVRLVKAALNFDEKTVASLVVPFKKVVFLNQNISLEEVKEVYSQKPFTRYPVLDRKKKIVGILSMKRVFSMLVRKGENDWQNQIDKNICYLSPFTKLNEAFEKSQSRRCRMMVVRSPKKDSAKLKKTFPFLGIITLHDILDALLGKVVHDSEKIFLPRSSPTQPLSTNPGSGDNPTKS